MLPSQHVDMEAAIVKTDLSEAHERAKHWDRISGEGGRMALTPNEDLEDGNECMRDEELFSDALCYKKCSLLTGGEFPIRTSAFTCCKKHPCKWHNTRHDFGLCSGFDVAGGNDGAC